MQEATVELGAEHADMVGDAQLTDAVRRGDMISYHVLYQRHLAAARRMAVGLGVPVAERDDLVAESFVRVLRVLRRGLGPQDGFRSYLLRTMRNAMIDWRRRDASVSPVAEVPDVLPVAGSDEVVDARVHGELAADAFARLPERWRDVLWRMEVHGETAAQVAKHLGMTPNSVSALAYRAREGLRRAYLDQHVPVAGRRNCDAVSRELAGWVRGRCTTQKARRIEVHLEECRECRTMATGLRQLNGELPSVRTSATTRERRP